MLNSLLDVGDHVALAEALINMHCDPAYKRSSWQDARRRLGQVALDALDASAIEARPTPSRRGWTLKPKTTPGRATFRMRRP